MEELRQEEQVKLDETIATIKGIIEDLQIKNRNPRDLEQQYQEVYRIKQLTKYEQAIENPYFGRLDIEENGLLETIYFGKTGIAKSDIEPLVVDWRSPLFSVFTLFNGGQRQIQYKSQIGEQEVYVHTKRHIKINRGKVISVDEIGGKKRTAEDQTDDSLLFEEDYLVKVLSEKNEKHQVKEIIATLQQEQDEIIRLDMSKPIIVQGAAGSGKSSIALHRISYLLYRYADMLKPENILVLAPNKMFLSYMQSVAPELEISDIQQSTFVELTRKYIRLTAKVSEPYEKLMRVINEELDFYEIEPISRYKGSIHFKQMIDLYIGELKKRLYPEQNLIINTETILNKQEIEKMFEGKSHLPINKLIREVIASIVNWVKQAEEKYIQTIHKEFDNACTNFVYSLPEGDLRKQTFIVLEQARDARIQLAHEEFKSKVKEYIARWRLYDPMTLYRNLLNRDLLKLLDPVLDDQFIDKLAVNFTDPSISTVDYEDLAPLLYLEIQLNGMSEPFDYIVIDEAQDLSPFQFHVIRQLGKSMTILGDITQSIFSFAGITDWNELQSNVFRENEVNQLTIQTSYRSTAQIMNLANLVIHNSSIDLPEIVPINRQGESPIIEKIQNANELFFKIKQSIQSFKDKGYSKIAIIPKDIRQAQSLYDFLIKAGTENLQLIIDSQQELSETIIIIPSYLVKGLEFDAVILPNASSNRFTDNQLDTKLLFVCITRANHELRIFYHKEISPLLEGAVLGKVETASEMDTIL